MSGQRKNQKINKQIKFQFFDKVLRQGLPVNKVAQEIGIRYSTARTIVFFQKNSHKSYRLFKLQSHTQKQPMTRAHYKEITIQDKKCIQIVTNYKFTCWQPRKEVKSNDIQLTYFRNSNKREIKQRLIGKRFTSSKVIQERNEDQGSDSQYLGQE